MTPKLTIAGLSATAIIMGGIDASALAETPLDRTEMVAEEIVQAKQVDNIVETNFPWKDQNGIKVKYDMGEPTLLEKLKDKRNKEVITETVDFGDGGFKVDILLNEKPSTNVFCYQIEGAENYDFFYQPPLTAEEIAEGAIRPENIEGSYAVYHKTLKNHREGAENYATGKVMHIPRPQVWELNNQANTTEWADLSYSEQDGLCVTARQEFLDNANYPVRIDPTFGYTSVGASGSSNNNFLSGTQFTSSESGNVSKLTINAYFTAEGDDNQTTGTGAIYLATDNTKVASTTEFTVSTTTRTWYDATFPTSVPVTAISYWLLLNGHSETINQIIFAFDTNAAVIGSRVASTYPTFPSTYSPSADNNREYSIYATYTASPRSCSGGICGGINLSGGMNIK